MLSSLSLLVLPEEFRVVFEWELDRRETPLDCPIVATLLTVFTSGVSYSSKTTPRALSSATSASISCVVQVICVWVPLAAF